MGPDLIYLMAHHIYCSSASWNDCLCWSLSSMNSSLFMQSRNGLPAVPHSFTALPDESFAYSACYIYLCIYTYIHIIFIEAGPGTVTPAWTVHSIASKAGLSWPIFLLGKLVFWGWEFREILEQHEFFVLQLDLVSQPPRKTEFHPYAE